MLSVVTVRKSLLQGYELENLLQQPAEEGQVTSV